MVAGKADFKPIRALCREGVGRAGLDWDVRYILGHLNFQFTAKGPTMG